MKTLTEVTHWTAFAEQMAARDRVSTLTTNLELLDDTAAGTEPSKHSTSTETSTQKDQGTMKNGTFSVPKLIAKATIELDANKKAVDKANRFIVARDAVLKKLQTQLDEEPVNLTEDGYALQVTSVSLGQTGPVVTDVTARLESAIRYLETLAEPSISWNEEVDFILQDFSVINGSRSASQMVVISKSK